MTETTTNKDNPRELFEQTLQDLAQQFSVEKIKLTTLNFDLEYERTSNGNIRLTSEKAIVRVLGKVKKVPIGKDHPHKSFEDAEKAIKNYWKEYYKNIRKNRSEHERKMEQERQRKYRERRKQAAIEFETRGN